MTSEPAYQALFLGAGLQMRCGIGQFTRLLCETIEKLDPGSCTTLTLTQTEGSTAEIWRAAGSARSIVCNFPIVAWKRVIFRPLLALAMARLRGRRVILIQHEWAGLHWLRRATCLPALLLADTIVMFSPLVRRELSEDRLVGWTARKCVLAPLPPNIVAPAGFADTGLRRRLASARQDGRLVIGHFGSIYPTAPCAAQHRRDVKGTRAQAADRLCRIVHPRRRRQRGAGILCPCRGSRRPGRCHCQRLCRLEP
jgi:hypothetical protein